MKRLGGIFVTACLAALPCAADALAQVEFYRAASTGFSALAVPVGVKGTAMAGACTAGGNDVYALHGNPAGLARLTGYQVGLAHNEWNSELGLKQDLIAYGQGLATGQAAAASLSYFSLGQFDKRDEEGVPNGQSRAVLISGALGYGCSLLSRRQLRAGLALEGAQQEMFGGALYHLGASLGLAYELDGGAVLGVSYNHLGAGLQGVSAPRSLNAGAALPALARRMTLALDLQAPGDGDTLLKAGVEYRLGLLALRGGYRQALGAPEGDVQSGLTAGAGFRSGVLQVDYAFTAYGALSTVHRLGMTLLIPQDFFKAVLAGGEGTVETARGYYEKAVDLEYSGETLRALIEYQRSVEAYPRKQKGSPEAFLLTAQKKVGDLQQEMNRRGDGGQLGNIVKELLANAKAAMRLARYRDALDPLKQALKLDPGNQAAAALMQEAQKGQEATLSGHRSAARAADRQGRLEETVESYQKLLVLDPSDTEAANFMLEHQSEIEALLRQIHRRGIYQYVAGDLEEAVKTWTRGKSLDYFGAVVFDRDIAKAKKRLGQLQTE